jgi:hypothetical protein
MVADLVMHHGMGVSVRAGQGHLFLYPSDGTKPFRVRAGMPAKWTLRYLSRWAVLHGCWEEVPKK